eukprot:7128791-Prorocentrum_lima.AAC.1
MEGVWRDGCAGGLKVGHGESSTLAASHGNACSRRGVKRSWLDVHHSALLARIMALRLLRHAWSPSPSL